MKTDCSLNSHFSPQMVSDNLSPATEQCPDAQVQARSRFPRSSRACIPCRERHLKCDGRPVCSRCGLDQRSCIYTKSRRGGKRRQTLKVPVASFETVGLDSSSSSNTTFETSSTHHTSDTNGSSHSSVRHSTDSDPYPITGSSELIFDNLNPSAATELQWGATYQPRNHDTEKLLNSYYENFHDAHPITLPRWNLDLRRETNPDSVLVLVNVLEYIGSIYDEDEDCKKLQQVALSSLFDRPPPLTGYSVQALVLLSMALHCSDAYEHADQILDSAIDLALKIQMQCQEFARTNGEGDPVLEESWRRTYWMMFFLDSLFAAISYRQRHRLQDIIASTDLPCEDCDYEIGVRLVVRSLTSYEVSDKFD
jgi:hypothetical protein